jgi:hypothetical protein
MTFLTISKKITFGGMFLVLAGIMVVGTVFFNVFLPETKGKSLEEIGAIFEDKHTKNDNRATEWGSVVMCVIKSLYICLNF